MGVSGLHPVIKPALHRKSIGEYRGQTAAIDAYAWLHRAAFLCTMDLVHKKFPYPLLNYFVKRFELLRMHGVEIIVVFDGSDLPAKAMTEKFRSRARQENMDKAKQFDSEKKFSLALKSYRMAVDICPEVAFVVVDYCLKNNIKVVIAPYEADSQLAYLSLHGIADLIITEDSDLVPLGAKRVAFKFDDHGYFDEYCQERTLSLESAAPAFRGWSLERLRYVCILAGCDYLASLKGIGMGKAISVVSNAVDLPSMFRALSYNTIVPGDYQANFAMALLAYQYQRVYDPKTKALVHLHEPPREFTEQESNYLGPFIEAYLCVQICEGRINPNTRMPYTTYAVRHPETPIAANAKRSISPSKRSLETPDYKSFLLRCRGSSSSQNMSPVATKNRSYIPLLVNKPKQLDSFANSKENIERSLQNAKEIMSGTASTTTTINSAASSSSLSKSPLSISNTSVSVSVFEPMGTSTPPRRPKTILDCFAYQNKRAKKLIKMNEEPLHIDLTLE